MLHHVILPGSVQKADLAHRLVAVSLVPLTVAPFAAGSLNPVTDAVLCATLLIHSHIGFEYVEICVIQLLCITFSANFWSPVGLLSLIIYPKNGYPELASYSTGFFELRHSL